MNMIFVTPSVRVLSRGAASGKKIVARMEFGASYMVRMGREGHRMPFPRNRVPICVAATSGRKLHPRIHFDTAAESISSTAPPLFFLLDAAAASS